MEPLTDIAPIPGTGGRVGGCGQGPPGQGRSGRRYGRLDGTGVGDPVDLPDGLSSTRYGRRRGTSAQGESRSLLTVDDQSCRGGVGAEMG